MIRLHLESCARCRAWAEEFAAVDAELAATLPRPALSPEFEARLEGRLAELTRQNGRGARREAAELEHDSLLESLRRGARVRATVGAVGWAGVTLCALLKSLRKEPQRRYTSVEQLSEDIRRYLEGLPVTARKDTLAYRTGKFVRRHRLGVVAAGLVVLALLGGITTTTWQARIAQKQRAREERRFNDVRKLANSVLFRYYDAIKNLAGSVPAQQMLVRDPLQYLDSMSQESADDLSLQRELAAAYERLGDVQGGGAFANLGNTAGALDSYRKSLVIREAITAANPTDLGFRRDLATSYDRLGIMMTHIRDLAGAREDLPSVADKRDLRRPAVFRDQVRQFAESEVRPLVARMDKEAQIPKELIRKCFELGIMGIEIPDQFGGAGATFFMSVLVVEELARVDASVAVLVDVQNTLVNNALLRFANDEQRARYFPKLASEWVGAYALSESGAGSDAFALSCRAEDKGDHYQMTGRKLWITNAGEAELFIVMANVHPSKGYKGITAFEVDICNGGGN